MKPYNKLSGRQQALRKNVFRIAIYGTFALVLFWSMNKMVVLEEEKQAQYSRIENMMIEYYRETKEQKDTVGMSTYMQKRLSLDDYMAWQQLGK